MWGERSPILPRKRRTLPILRLPLPLPWLGGLRGIGGVHLLLWVALRRGAHVLRCKGLPDGCRHVHNDCRGRKVVRGWGWVSWRVETAWCCGVG